MTPNLINSVEEKVVSSAKNAHCASIFCREPTNENKLFSKTKTYFQVKT